MKFLYCDILHNNFRRFINRNVMYNKEVRVTYCDYTPESFTGKSSMFQSKASYFLFGNGYIVMNNTKFKEFSFSSKSTQPNFNYSVLRYITVIFRFLNIHKLDKVLQTKYFKCIRRHILIIRVIYYNYTPDHFTGKSFIFQLKALYFLFENEYHNE